MARVVILGAGVSGHTAALHLRRKLDKSHDVVVVAPNSKWNWIPSNIWVGVGRMTREQVTFPLAPIYARKGIEFHQALGVGMHPEGDSDSPQPYVDITYTDPDKAGQSGRLDYDYLINATGPKLNFGATPGLGPDGYTVSVCTDSHAIEAAEPSRQAIEKMHGGQRQTLVVGTGHGTCTCEGAAFEYAFNVEHELRAAGVRDMADLVYLSNEYELGDFGVGGMVFTQKGFQTTSKTWTESLFRERGMKAITGRARRAHRAGRRPLRAARRQQGELAFDFAMLLPPFRGADLKAYDATGADISSDIFAPNGFMKVDADYSPKPYDQWRAEDWPNDLPMPRVRQRVRRRDRVRPAAPDLRAAQEPERDRHHPGAAAHRDAVRGHGQGGRGHIAEMIASGSTEPEHTASMAKMGAACIASAGAGWTKGTAAAMTMYPIVPDYVKYPGIGRSLEGHLRRDRPGWALGQEHAALPVPLQGKGQARLVPHPRVIGSRRKGSPWTPRKRASPRRRCPPRRPCATGPTSRSRPGGSRQ